MSDEQLEKKNQKKAFLYTTLRQMLLFVGVFFIVAWRAPDPPLSEYGSGIELNFGLDDQGFGEVQPETPVGNDGGRKEEVEDPKPTPPNEAPRDEPRAE